MVSPNRESGIGLGSGSGRDGSWKVLWIQVSRSLSLLLMVKPPVFLVVVGMGRSAGVDRRPTADLISLTMPTVNTVFGHTFVVGFIFALSHDYLLIRSRPRPSPDYLLIRSGPRPSPVMKLLIHEDDIMELLRERPSHEAEPEPEDFSQ
ncbi:hypothetical protein ACFX1R_036432 [Malus domestica]